MYESKTMIKRIIACAMTVFMMLTIAPLSGFVGLELGLSASAAIFCNFGATSLVFYSFVCYTRCAT